MKATARRKWAPRTLRKHAYMGAFLSAGYIKNRPHLFGRLMTSEIVSMTSFSFYASNPMP